MQDYSNAVIAVATVVYTVLTSVLAIITWRSTSIATKALSHSRMPNINLEVKLVDNSPKLIVKNDSDFSANDITIKYSFFKKKNISCVECNSTQSVLFEEVLGFNKKIRSFKVSYKNEFEDFFTKKIYVNIPAIIRRHSNETL